MTPCMRYSKHAASKARFWQAHSKSSLIWNCGVQSIANSTCATC